MKELFALIKSLSPDEKKYFKRYGLKDESKGKSHTEALFEILEGLAAFDETKINFALKRKALDKQAGHLKQYLHKLLTETLVWYNREKIPRFSAAFEQAQIYLLEDRGLDDEAVKISEKAVKDALQNGSFIERWDALGKNIYFASNEFLSDRKKDFENVQQIVDEREKLLLQMQQYHRLDALLMLQLRIMRRTMQAQNEEDVTALNTIFKESCTDANAANSRESRFIQHTIKLHHYYIFNQWLDFFDEGKAAVAFINKEGKERFPRMKVLWTYSQLAQACYFTQNWPELENCLSELQATPVNNQTEEIARFTYYTQLAITLLDHKQNEQSLRTLLSETTSKLHEFGNRLRPDIRLAITITCASAMVEYGEYEKAIELCENFLVNYDSGVRLDALLMLYVYEFICHLELGNQLYVNSTIQNVDRYFLRNNYKSPFETALMKVFKKISAMADAKTGNGELEKLKTELEKASNDAANRQHLALLPIVNSFIDARIAGKKIHEWSAEQKKIR